MKKTENLVATLLVIYGVLCAVSIALYALIQLFVDDKSTATNLLIWSATIFAPIAVLMTYTSWREQKSAEIISHYSDEVFKGFIEYFKILENYSLFSPRRGDELEITKKLEDHYERIYSTLILYCEFLRTLDRSEYAKEFEKLDREHYKLLTIMQALNEEDDNDSWCEYSFIFVRQLKETSIIVRGVMKELVKIILHRN